MSDYVIRLDDVARQVGISRQTLERWHKAGRFGGRNLGPGARRGILLRRQDAIELMALITLRHASRQGRLAVDALSTPLRNSVELAVEEFAGV